MCIFIKTNIHIHIYVDFSTYLLFFSSIFLSNAQGNHLPIILLQSTLKVKNNTRINKTTVNTDTTIIENWLLASETERTSSIIGRPKKTVPQTIISPKMNFPRNVTIVNFLMLYLASPKGI